MLFCILNNTPFGEMESFINMRTIMPFPGVWPRSVLKHTGLLVMDRSPFCLYYGTLYLFAIVHSMNPCCAFLAVHIVREVGLLKAPYWESLGFYLFSLSISYLSSLLFFCSVEFTLRSVNTYNTIHILLHYNLCHITPTTFCYTTIYVI